MAEVKETKKTHFPYQNRAKANGISPNLYHSGCSPKLSHTPLQFGRKCQSVSIRRQLDAMFKRQAYSWDRGYDKEHGGDVISFLTHVCTIWWLDGVCPCLHLSVCVCWEEDDFFLYGCAEAFWCPSGCFGSSRTQAG